MTLFVLLYDVDGYQNEDWNIFYMLQPDVFDSVEQREARKAELKGLASGITFLEYEVALNPVLNPDAKGKYEDYEED